MQARVTEKPEQQVIAAIQALDLEAVKLRVTDPELGEGWTREYADSIETAYKTYLTMLVKYQNDAEDILLSEDVDEFWHTHILQTRKYAEDCQKTFGHFLHHEPHVGQVTSVTLEHRNAQAEKTRVLYEREFGSMENASAAWSGITVAGQNAAYSAASIRAQEPRSEAVGIKPKGAAYSATSVRSKTAAYSAASIAQDTAAYSAASIRAGAAAYSAASIRPKTAVYPAAGINQQRAAYSAASIRADVAAYSAASIRPETAAYSAASIRANVAAYSAASIRPEKAAYSAVSIASKGPSLVVAQL